MNIEKEKFEAWLYSQPRDRRVDLSDGTDCLICKFVKETTNCIRPRATWGQLLVDHLSPYDWTNLPEWLTNHIEPNRSTLQTFGEIQDSFREIFPVEESEEVTLSGPVNAEPKTNHENTGPLAETSTG